MKMESMHLKCQSEVVGLYAQPSRGMAPHRKQRSRWLHRYGFSSPSPLCGQQWNGRRDGLLRPTVCSGIEPLYSIASKHCNLKAWTKTAENFYGDEDDTLLEPTHDNALVSEETNRGNGKTDDNTAANKFFWPLWLFGPFILLGTGVIPTLWLPVVPLFEGSATAGLLALAGLDGIFNLGASAFLLLTDSCARRWRRSLKKADPLRYELPPGYKGWTLLVNAVGLLGPLIAYVASKRGFLGAEPALLPTSAMIVPYLSLLLVQACTELLVWQWQSPVWAILPLVYDCYSVIQLSRGLQLGQALGAPLWTIEAVKGLISWWVLVLAVQLMWIAWVVAGSVK